MTDKENIISEDVEGQLFPDILRKSLPVSFYKLTKHTGSKFISPLKNFSESNFHMSKTYVLLPFYKSISNIL